RSTWGELSAGRRPHRLVATGRTREQSDAHRREPEPREGWIDRELTRGTVVSRSPGQAPSLVARRKPDLPVPPWWRAPPPHPLVGSDRCPAPIGPGRGGRRRSHDRVLDLRGPGAERRCG